MCFKYKFLAGLVLLMCAVEASANEEENAGKLGAAIRQNIVVNYTCQEYLGGLVYYRVAKSSATSIFSRITGDKNQTVLDVDKLEKKLKASSLQGDLEKKFNKLKLDYLGRVGVCQDMVAEHHDKVQVLMAKLGLL